MDAVVRTPSRLAAPLVHRLFRDPARPPVFSEPVPGLVSWRGARATATPDEVHRTAADLVHLAAERHAAPTAELAPVVDVLGMPTARVTAANSTDFWTQKPCPASSTALARRPVGLMSAP
ncbi:hypothetical protein ABVB25_36235 [Streptomyces anthocyanicus]|uniref:hypothetical protein n=1 Tax=Streptomyces anthocyanicus TaxID=68174 RepID=UPI00336A583B